MSGEQEMMMNKAPDTIPQPCRCAWAGTEKLMQDYHDTQWGVPCHDERVLFEMLILEGMQAGLSWATILNKRQSFRQAFDHFDPAIIADYDEQKLSQLLQNPGIIRNRLKVNAAVTNARAYKTLCAEFGSLDAFLWAYVDGNPIVGFWDKMGDVPITTPLSDQISAALKKLGFKFVGSTIIYSYMQAVGLVNDHLSSCDFGGHDHA